MASPLMELQLHQVGIERCECAIEGATQFLHDAMPGLGNISAGIWISEPGCKMRGQAIGVIDRYGAARAIKRRVDFRKVPDMRAVQNGAPEFGGFNRVLAAMPTKEPPMKTAGASR